jgi:hypothetical protein
MVGSTRVNFVFEPTAGINKYQLLYYDSPSDSSNRSRSSGSPVITKNHDPDTTFYWRARVRNNYAYSELSQMRSFITPPVTATTTILPDNGVTLTPDPGNISITFPPMAVTATTTLTYTLLPLPAHDLANFRFAGRAFTLEASDEQGRPVTNFERPFTMTIAYDGDDLFAAGAFPSELNLTYWDGANWQNILPCAGCSNDTDNRIVTVVIDHLSEFALLADTSTRSHTYLPVITKQE